MKKKRLIFDMMNLDLFCFCSLVGLLISSSPMSCSFGGNTLSFAREGCQSTSSLERPRPVLGKSENNHIYPIDSTSYTNFNNTRTRTTSNCIDKDSSSDMKFVTIGKEESKTLSTNAPSVSINKNSSLSKNTGEILSARLFLENTVVPPERIYENVPILIQTDHNPDSFYNIPIVNGNNQQQDQLHPYVTIVNDRNCEIQRNYLSQLLETQNGISVIIPQQTISNNSSISKENTPTTTNETISNYGQYSEQILFANYLTNPLFNIDRQLLANTIANQFGVDLNSPYLQQLIANQHLFVTHKRTFANMVWRMTPEEESALCSSPSTIKSIDIDQNITGTNNSTAKSILKSNKISRLSSKRQHISWDGAL